jgi:AcrR family transcriptional regulator
MLPMATQKRCGVAAAGRKAEDSARTRTAILDATEAIMREDGYAAVSTRRISEKAGVNLGLIHYHFGSMDDLFRALFQRTDRLVARYEAALGSADTLEVLWEAHNHLASNTVLAEFLALANHRKAIREEIAASVERVRACQTAVLSRILTELGVDLEDSPPVVLALLLSSTSRGIAMESLIGVKTGHAETLAFVKRYLDQLRTGALGDA